MARPYLDTYLWRDTMPPRKKFSRMIRQLREERKMSQLELAQKSGVAQGYISELEAGTKGNPGLDVLKKVAKALGVPVTELLG
jgi:transcriptional regulator with XRE-family HTH domain